MRRRFGLTPVTVCSDLLKPSGYRRGWTYISDLVKRMDAVGATDIDGFTLQALGQAEAALARLALPHAANAACRAALASGGDLRAAAGEAFPAWISAARVLNAEAYAERVIADPYYSAAENATPPNKVGSALVLFDCLTCDKCIPLCPNDANFALAIPPGETPVERAARGADGWNVEVIGSVKFAKPRQIATFADACNECGNCGVLCPEDGGPYLTKPLFFGSLAAFKAARDHDGFFVERRGDGFAMRGRFGGEVVTVESRRRRALQRRRLRPRLRSRRRRRDDQRVGRRPGRLHPAADDAADAGGDRRAGGDQLRQRGIARRGGVKRGGFVRRQVVSRPASSFVKECRVLSRVVKAFLDATLRHFKGLRPLQVDKRASAKLGCRATAV